MNVTIRRTGALLAATALTVSLAACSGGQSVAEACTVAEKAMEQAAEQSQSLLGGALNGGDSAELDEALKSVQDGLDDAIKQVSNEEVGAALKQFDGAFDGMMGDIKALQDLNLDGIDFTAPDAQEKVAAAQKQLEELTPKLESGSADMQAAGDKLTELCGK